MRVLCSQYSSQDKSEGQNACFMFFPLYFFTGSLLLLGTSVQRCRLSLQLLGRCPRWVLERTGLGPRAKHAPRYAPIPTSTTAVRPRRALAPWAPARHPLPRPRHGHKMAAEGPDRATRPVTSAPRCESKMAAGQRCGTLLAREGRGRLP